MLLYNIIIGIITLICVLLILVVLLQSGQGDGLAGMGGGGGSLMGNSGLGARRTADLLSKATSIFGGAFLVLCILANFAIDRGGVSRSILQEGGGAVAPNTNIPSQSNPAVPVVPPADSNSGSDSQNEQ